MTSVESNVCGCRRAAERTAAVFILTEGLAHVHVHGPAHSGGVREAGRNAKFKIGKDHDQIRILERSTK